MASGARSGRNKATDNGRTLAGIAVLAALSPRELALLAAECDWRKISCNEIVLNLAQGDTMAGVVFVVSGGVRLARSVGNAGRIAYVDVDAGGQFGEMAVFGVAETDLTVVAREDGLIAIMPEARFVELLSREESVSRALLCQYARLLRAGGTGTSPPTASTRGGEGTGVQRVYGELLALAEPHRTADGEDCLLIARLPRHRELAARVDTTEEVVARAIAEIVRGGIATRAYPGLVVDDEAALRALCEPR